ncbi:hypothetical protein VOLCADRAFT_116448 [Volvox carteri f. nagariensis]|uniref:Uncharacterized protein n=1 Tax=Volvox carteri f. nagariensis TaxID=3068 RepID=D8TM79_VOLCA|nr:uncharacterized protein VOLCADRAFT_116448 [Volvox carteri f. nagariensis]EFJ51456.1 hypothetical protein VOLCADRAFT_116448 [Volvox carteri f. nagariensis]|eukprot:XP_002947408.1 hypothetical protein VOLCADRAFT_116448 [Volvox carteri f. nagariensis]
MDISQRDIKLGIGLVAAAASRYYFNKRQLWPWRISTLIAWPALGLAVMDTVISYQAPKDVIIRKVLEAKEKSEQ